MKALISDKTYLTKLTTEQSHAIQKALTFRNPKHVEAQSNGRSTWGIPRLLELFEETVGGLSIPRGIKLQYPAEIQDERHSHPIQFGTNIELRGYQERAVRLAISAGGGVLVAVTGAGKTTMGIELASRLGQRCLILVKSLDLAKQWVSAIKQFTGLECGLIGGGKWSEGGQFTVGLVQTLSKHFESLNYGMVIVDEAHNCPAVQAFDVINRQCAKYRFGLSATPQRRDNLEFLIFCLLGAIVAEIEDSEVLGSVLPVLVKTVTQEFSGNPESWSEFINLLAADEVRNQMIIDSAVKSSGVVGTAVLTATVEHAERLHSLAKDRGTDAVLLHGQLPKKDRELGMLNAPNSQLIFGTLSLLSEGIDWPHVGAIIFASPVSASVDRESPAATRLIQSIGRGRRPFPGKRRCFVLDIVDEHNFGISASRKRAEIYRLQGWEVRSQG